MRRMACVDLPALPLQILLRHHPDWRRQPVAVVDSDRPQGRILWVSERAWAARILPGMRYAAALSLAGSLRAGVVPPGEVEKTVEAALACLHQFTPDVEPAVEDEGLFWLDATGLDRLFPSLSDWARRLRSALESREGLEATVVVGFSRFGTSVVARASRGVTVFRERSEEQAAARRVPLERLPLGPRARESLRKLGARTVGDLAGLPAEGIRKRFGPEAWRLHRQARGELELPLAPSRPEEPRRREVHLDHAESDLFRLVLVIARELHALLAALGGHQAAGALELRLGFEGGGERCERLRPAAPTRDLSQLVELLRLRLEAARPGRGVTDLLLEIEPASLDSRQLELFERPPPRDLAAANRALARLRAELGEDAVVRARLRDGHLPEALFFWERLETLRAPAARAGGPGALVRRLYGRPLALPPRPRQEPDGWLLRGLEQGPVVRVLGPYVVSGGWWRRLVWREYHFAETQKGEILWVYYDRLGRRWFLEGRVE